MCAATPRGVEPLMNDLAFSPLVPRRRWWTRPRPMTFVLAALVSLAALGCAGSDGAGDDASDDAAITAGEANAKGFALREHVLSGEPASAEARRELGIVKWDVFAGADPKSGFSGAIYYASDADGDVRYAYSVDVPTQQVALIMLAKSGQPMERAKIAPAQASRLVNEVAGLKDKLAANRATSCAVTLGVAAALVVVAGVAIIATPVELVVSVMAGFGAGYAVVGEATSVAMGGLGMLISAGAFASLATGFGYVTYTVTNAAAAATRNASTCVSGQVP